MSNSWTVRFATATVLLLRQTATGWLADCREREPTLNVIRLQTTDSEARNSEGQVSENNVQPNSDDSVSSDVKSGSAAAAAAASVSP